MVDKSLQKYYIYFISNLEKIKIKKIIIMIIINYKAWSIQI